MVGGVIMTQLQKERIVLLRNKGIGYGSIATELNLSLNTVKSYCRRNNLNAEVNSLSDVCTNCSSPITHTAKAKKKRFCSDKCRVAWWNSHPAAVKQKAVYNFVCPCCNTAFSAYGNSKRKFCSHKCYINSRFKVGVSHE
jgi:endogenous inhibitor of DNA gyrase (YacG/DUF329 family)